MMILSLLLTMAAQVWAADYSVDGNAVTVAVRNAGTDGARKVCLQAMRDNIIRVRATPEESFPQKNSLIVVPEAFSGMLPQRRFNIVYVKPGKHPVALNLDNPKGKMVKYVGKEVKVKLK